MSDEAKKRLLSVLPHLRESVQEAKELGKPRLGVFAETKYGTEEMVSAFNAEEFIADLCLVLGVPAENTDEETLDARALQMVQTFERAGLLGKDDGTPKD